MVELSEECIDVIKRIKDTVKSTSFKINAFRVSETGANGEMIEVDIRRHNEDV